MPTLDRVAVLSHRRVEALQTFAPMPYSQQMNDHPDTPAPPAWREALERSRADVAGGRVVDGASVRRRIKESIARMEACRANTETEATAPRK